MRSSFFKSLAEHLILALSILLVFLLIFEPFLQIPDFLLFAGRLHPVILHFPIVLLVLTVINSFTKNRYEQPLLLTLTVLVTLATAITGFLLSEENTSKGDILTWHQWMGAAVSLLAATWYGLEKIKLNQRGVLLSVRISILVLILSTGHFGGMVTHGRDFLSWNRAIKDPVNKIPDDPLVFEHMVLPVLQTKCISCHNEDKSKGGLILSDHPSILRGGESGSSVVPGDPGQSEVLRRIHLPLADEDHMPPVEQEQLSDSEIRLFEGWIAKGMPEEMKASSIGTEDPFYVTIQKFKPVDDPSKKWAQLPEVEESIIDRLSSDYCTIRRMSQNSNALSVMIFPSPEYSTHRLSPLQPILDNIVELDLSFLPLTEEEMTFISKCKSLEWLEIDFTPVDDDQFNHLGEMNNLRILKAQGSGLTEKSLEKILNLRELEKLFLWDTDIPEDKLEQLKTSMPDLDIEAGIDKSISFISTLPAPKVSPEQTFFIDPIELRFEHPLKAIDILYTLDVSGPDTGQDSGMESDPLTQGTVYKDPIRIEKSGKLKFMASKEGWEPSDVDSILFFKTSRGPDQVSLEFPPDPKYTGKGAVVLFDLKKGSFNLQDSAWLGFQEKPLELHCSWKEAVTLQSINLSSYINPGIHVFPPSLIEVKGGDRDNEERLGISYPTPIKPNERSGFHYFNCRLEPKPITHLSIIVKPLPALPDWHDAKGKPGWFFVDEMILEE